MPYINPNLRKCYDEAIEQVLSTFDSHDILEAPGILNYIISTIVWKLFNANKSYRMANTLIGILECVKQELYRVQIAPMEDEKRLENGDLEL